MEGALVEWLQRRVEFLTNWVRGILLLSADTGCPAGLLNKNKRDNTSCMACFYKVLGSRVLLRSVLLCIQWIVNRFPPGPAAACRRGFGGLVIGLVQIGLFPWRVLNGRAMKLPAELAWRLLGCLKGLGWQLDGIWIWSAQHWRRERASRVHVYQSERTSVRMRQDCKSVVINHYVYKNVLNKLW